MKSQLLIFTVISLYVMSCSFTAFQTLIFNSLAMIHLGVDLLMFILSTLGFIQLLWFADFFSFCRFIFSLNLKSCGLLFLQKNFFATISSILLGFQLHLCCYDISRSLRHSFLSFFSLCSADWIISISLSSSLMILSSTIANLWLNPLSEIFI